VKELVVRLAVATAVIGAMTTGAWWVINRPDTPASATVADAGTGASTGTEATGNSDGDAGRPRLSENQARSALQQIGEVSQRLMPDGYTNIFLGMPLPDLRAERRRIQRETEARADGQQVWAEDDPNGARVVYLVSQHGLLTQVQFMSRIEGTEGLAPHFAALQQKYGRPTGIWDCPETAESSPMRRFTWRREGASMMEAVLIHGQSVSITLVVTPTEDVATALQRSRCAPVQSAEQLERFPVAGELRGERTNFIREIRPDAG
jgi:hypothetical protein